MPERELDILKAAAQKAGEIALSYHRRSPASWEKDGDLGPVSEADLAVNDFLIGFFSRELPDCAILSEESEDDLARLAADRLIVVDPIDGTKAYLKGESYFAVSIGLLDQGAVTSAVIHAPARDEFFWAAKSEGAFLNGDRLKVAQADDLNEAHVLASKARYNRDVLEAFSLNIDFRPSIALRMAYVASGQFDMTLSLRPSWDWDIIAGDLIVSEAGGMAVDATGQAPRYNQSCPKQNGIVAGNPVLVNKLIAEMELRKNEQG